MFGYGTCSSVVGWQLRFSLYSGAVTTKTLAVVVSLYYLLVSGSVGYPVHYALCLLPRVLWSVALCVRLYSCGLLGGALLVPALLQLGLSKVLGFCSLFYLVHIYNAPWDRLSGLMHSGIACLVSKAPD